MRKEKFAARYRVWNNEKLLSAFRNRKDYRHEAVEAMLEVLKERRMEHEAEKIEFSDRVAQVARVAAEEELLSIKQQAYEQKMLGDVRDAWTFARLSKGAGGVYMAGDVLRSRLRVIRVFAMSWALVAFVFTFLSIGIGSIFPYSTLVFAGSILAFGGLAFFLHRVSRARYSFYERNDGKNIFELRQNNFHFIATVPFAYSVCRGHQHNQARGLRVSHPVLFLTVTNRQNESVTLLSNLSVFEEPPPAWPQRASATLPQETVFFNEIPLEPLDLLRLKKILDGLHEESGVRVTARGSMT